MVPSMLRVIFSWIALGTIANGQLKFEKLKDEVVAKPEGGVLRVEFPFKNDGDKPVTISRYDSGCGCLSGKLEGNKKTYAPDEKGVVHMEIDSTNLHGLVEKQLGIWVEGNGEQPAATLSVAITVPDLIKLEPKTLHWNLGEEPVAKTIVVTMNYSEPVRITGLSGTDPQFTEKFKVIEDGRKYEIEVTPSDTATGCLSNFRIETDCGISRLKTQIAFMNISATPGTSPKK
jgi:hypothetical protein